MTNITGSFRPGGAGPYIPLFMLFTIDDDEISYDVVKYIWIICGAITSKLVNFNFEVLNLFQY